MSHQDRCVRPAFRPGRHVVAGVAITALVRASWLHATVETLVL